MFDFRNRWKIQGNEEAATGLANFITKAKDLKFKVEEPFVYHGDTGDLYLSLGDRPLRGGLPKGWRHNWGRNIQTHINLLDRAGVIERLKKLDNNGIPLPYFRGIDLLPDAINCKVNNFKKTAGGPREKNLFEVLEKEECSLRGLFGREGLEAIPNYTLRNVEMSLPFLFKIGERDYLAEIALREGQPVIHSVTVQVKNPSFEGEINFPYKASLQTEIDSNGQRRIIGASFGTGEGVYSAKEVERGVIEIRSLNALYKGKFGEFRGQDYHGRLEAFEQAVDWFLERKEQENSLATIQ